MSVRKLLLASSREYGTGRPIHQRFSRKPENRRMTALTSAIQGVWRDAWPEPWYLPGFADPDPG